MTAKKIIVDLEHLDTMNKFSAFEKAFAESITTGDAEKTYGILAQCVKEWGYDGDPSKPESYGELHPRSFRKVIEAVAAAKQSFFQD